LDHRDVDERMLVGDATGRARRWRWERKVERREKRRAKGERERKREVSLPRREARELYSLLSIFGTSLASPRRNPALAPS
jgi:hypothetical protein